MTEQEKSDRLIEGSASAGLTVFDFIVSPVEQGYMCNLFNLINKNVYL